MRFLYALIFLLTLSSAWGQQAVVRGVVRDSTLSSLVAATVKLKRGNDSVVTTTNHQGVFVFSEISFGKYWLSVSYIGYQNFETWISCTEQKVDAGNIDLQQKIQVSETVKIVVNNPVKILGDTVQFNANSFKTNPDATAEDLVKKMPGISVENGTVKAQGENVTKVTVDGKTYFGEDANIALKNINAEMVEKIEVFDQMSDQAIFTGFDDGNSTKSMNIVTKAKYRNGVNGKIYAGAGTNEHYVGGGTFNSFSSNRRISLLGLSNNINQQNFSSDDITAATGAVSREGVGKGGGFNANNPTGFISPVKLGISAVNSLGLNYSESFGKRVKIQGSYFFNNGRNSNTQEMLRTFYNTSSSVSSYTEKGIYLSDNYNHRFNFKLDYNIDSLNSISFSPSVSVQVGDIDNAIMGVNWGGSSMINSTGNDYLSNLTSHRFSNDLAYRHAFHKKGRTISTSLLTEWTSKSNQNYLKGINDYNGSVLSDTLDQNTESSTVNNNFSLGVSYTEPLMKGMVLLINLKESFSPNTSNVETNRYDVLQQTYSDFDTALSSDFQSNVYTHLAGLGWRFNTPKMHLMVASNYQRVDLSNVQTVPISGAVTKSYNNILPNVSFKFKVSPQQSIRLNYKTQVNVPSVLRLQEVWNNSNPLLLSIGNASLKTSYVNNVNVKWLFNNAAKMRSFMLFAMLSQTKNYIANSTQLVSVDELAINGVVLKKGSRYTKPLNLNGTWITRAYATFATPLKPLKSNFNLSGGYSFQNIPTVVNSVEGFSRTSNYNTALVLSSNISEKFDFTISTSATFSDVKSTLQSSQNYNYFNLLSSAKVNFLFWKGIVVQSEVSHTWYTGLDAFNRSYFLWNMALGKKFFKDQRGDLRLSVFDVLMQNNSISRTVNDFYVDDIRNVVLQQYYMLTFTYKFKKYKAPEEETVK